MPDFNSVLYSVLGQRIRDRREEMQFSQQQLADFVSLSYTIKRSSISNIERGRQQPPLHIIYEISKVLNLDVQTILPTYSEIFAKINIPDKPDLETLIGKYNLDSKTLKELNNTIKQFKK